MVCLERVKAWFSQICVQPEGGWAQECVIGDWVQEKSLMQHEVVKRFLMDVVDEVMGVPRDVKRRYGMKTSTNNCLLDIQEFESFARKVYTLPGIANMSSDEFQKSVQELFLQENNTALNDIVKVLDEVFKARKLDLVSWAQHQVVAISKWYLRDFDYSVKLVTSSSKLASMHDVRLQLKMFLTGHNAHKNVTVEMNEQELSDLLGEMEKIDETFDSLEMV